MQGRFQIGEVKHILRFLNWSAAHPDLEPLPQAYDKKRREAATKIISERLKKEDKAKKDRGDYYTEQKRV